MSIVLDGTTGITTPALDSTAKFVTANMPVGSVLQVVQVVKTDTFSTSSTSFTDVTGLSVSITPSSATSKVLVIPYAVLSNSNTSSSYFSQARILRDSTAIFVGDAAGNRTPAAFGSVLSNSANSQAATPIFLDSPATTSSVTYKLQVVTESGGTATIGRIGSDADSASYGRYSASITVMEIAA